MNVGKVFLIGAILLLLCSCSTFFASRVERLDAHIARLEAVHAEAPSPQTAEELDRLRSERDQALGGALQESANKQALLLALVGLGVGGLKLAAGAMK